MKTGHVFLCFLRGIRRISQSYKKNDVPTELNCRLGSIKSYGSIDREKKHNGRMTHN